MDATPIPSVQIATPPPDIPPLPKQTNKLFFVIGGLVILLIGLSARFVLVKSSSTEKPNVKPSGVACTQEAKTCPDGSSVGRSGPNCEFALCPQITSTPIPTPNLSIVANQSATTNLKTYINMKYKYTFQYFPDPKLKLFGCSMRVSGEKGEETVVFDEINSTFPECAFGGYALPITISVENNPSQCTARLGYTSSQSEIKVADVITTKCTQKFTEFPNQNSEYIKGPDDIIDVFLANEGKYYRFTLTNLKYSQTFDQILPTFKFL